VSAAPLLEARGLSFAHRGGGFLLEIERFEVTAGESVALVGPSGCGKTTLLELLVGLRLPQRGEIRFRGAAAAMGSDAARRRWRLESVGLVFQDLQLVESLDGLDNIVLAYLLEPRMGSLEEAKRRGADLADRLGVGGLLRRRIGRTSRGERQRLAVCRALVSEPPLVVADEPTASLDAASAEIVVEALLGHAGRPGAALIMATHDREHLPRFARVAEMPSPRGTAP
jgi:putative ABC transport system ATP-binding protein